MKIINKLLIGMLLLMIIPLFSASENYSTTNSVFYNFSVSYNSEPVYTNGTGGRIIVGNVNGNVDDVILFNTYLSQADKLKVYTNTYGIFYNIGEMLFQNINFFQNTKVNISIENCQTYNETSLSLKINNGNYTNFTNCNITIYNLTGNLTDANLTIKMTSNSFNSYSPVLNGNISLNDYGDITPPNITILSPLPQTYTTNLIDINISGDEELSSCVYSLDGASNISLDATGINYIFNKLQVNFPDGTHNLRISCNDTSGNWGSASTNFSVHIVNISLGTNISVFQFKPISYTQKDLSPTNQTNSMGIINFTNLMDNNISSVEIRVNQTQLGWSIKCSNNFSGTYNVINTTYSNIYSNLGSNNSFQIWCKADLSNPTTIYRGKLMFNVTVT
jgi:hypothetical protein